MRSKRKALFLTIAVGTLLLTPILYLRWLDAVGDPAEHDLGGIGDFLATDTAGQAMSRFDLDGNLTFVAWLGGVCRPAATDARCERARAQVAELTAWVSDRLLYSDKTEQSPVRLVLVAPAGFEAAPPWRKVEVAADGTGDARALLPDGCVESGAPLVVIDQGARVRRCFPLAGEESWTELKPLLSRMTINHYMQDYLAKRTFFRREPKEAVEQLEPATH